MAAEFNANDYFANRRAAIANEPTPQDKFSALNKATEEKVAQLGQMAATAEKRKALGEASWVGQLGLDEKSIAGRIVNVGANVYSGAGRVAGDAIGFVAGDLEAMAADASLSEPEKQAIGRYQAGTASEADVDMLTQKKGAMVERTGTPEEIQAAQIADDRSARSMTPIEIFEKATAARLRSSKIDKAFDVSGVVQADRKNQLVSDLGENFDMAWDQTKKGAKDVWAGNAKGSVDVASGLAKLLYNAGEAAITNPGASLEYIAENVPQLAVGAAGKAGHAMLTLTNVGYASENYQKGIAKYQAENNGAYPSAEKRAEMALYAASTALAEHVMDTKLLSGIKGTADAARTGFKESLKNIGKTTAAGTAGEAVTEGYQTYAEGEASLTPASAKDIYTGAAIGGIAGGGMTAGGRTLAEISGATPEQGAARAEVAKKNEALDAAIATGDVSALTDPKNVAYAPEVAVAALFGNSQLSTATPETKQANLEKANEIVAELETKKEKAEAAYATVSPAGVQGYKDQLIQVQAAMAAATPEQKVTLTETASLLEEAIADAAKDPKAAVRLETQMAKFDRQLTEARKSMTAFNQELQSAEVDIAAQVATINSVVDQADARAVAARSAAADTLINLSMAIPERLDTAVAIELAENAANGLTSPQRDYLRAFTAARVAENVLKDIGGVSEEIYVGSKANVGIQQYRARITEALAGGNKGSADRSLRDLVAFDKDHRAKAEVAEQAWEEGKGTQIVRTKDGQWEVASTPMTVDAVRKNGGLTLNTEKLVTTIQAEASALSAAVAELNAAYAVKFPSTKAPDVTNTSQARPGTSTPATGPDQAPQAAVPAPATTPDVPAARGASVVDTGVGVAGGVQSTQSTEKTAVETQAAPAADSDVVVSNSKSTESTTVDAEPAKEEPQPESAEQTVIEPDVSSEVVSGKLTALAQKSAEGVEFNARNLIADYFTQSASREGDVTQRPLVAAQNFLSEGYANVLEYLQLDALSDNQLQVLKTFREKAAAWSVSIQENLFKRENPAFNYTDMMQFLIQDADGKPDVDENVKTAMSYAGFSWIAENVARSMFNSDEEINAILDRDESAPVNADERNALGTVGARQNVVVNALGQRTVQALGLSVSRSAPKDLLPKLEAAIGAHVMKLLLDQGVLERSIISGSKMAQMTGNATTNEKASFPFIKIARDADFKLSPQAEEIFQASRSTQGVLDKLFGVESGIKEPSQAPIPFDQAKTRNTSQDVPERLAKIVAHENSVPSYVRQDMWQLVTQLDDDLVLQMAGAASVDETTTHASNLPSAQAKKDGLARELDRFKEYVGDFLQNLDEGLDSPLYFEHSVWKQQRVGIATNAINPQTSKIHRHMTFRKTWETKVARNNPVQMDNFYLRVAEGLGVKTDKQGNEKSLAAYEKKVADPSITAAVAVLRKAIYQGGITREEQVILASGVKTGGENFHSLDALVALAHYEEAAANDKPEFTVALMGEVDGVTNGPMLSHLLMGAAPTVQELFGLLNRGGFFEEGNEHNQYNLWREAAGHLDLYETTSLHMTQEVQKLLATEKNIGAVMSAIYGFTGTLADKDGAVTKAGRNIIKTPLTAMVFGSSVGAAVESMANKFVEAVYAGIEDLAAGKGDRADLILNVNLLLSQGKAPMIAGNLTVAQLMKLEFSADQIKGLKNTFKNTLGKAVRTTMETDFASYIEQRQQFNLAAQTTFDLYNAVHSGMREEMIAELVKSGAIATNSKGQPIHDLTPQQEAELRKRLVSLAPVMHTLMSKDSGSLNSGLHISKSSRKLSTKSTYEGEIKFGTKFADNGAASTLARGYETVDTAPGVAMAPMSVHSTDSAISHYAADGNEVLNVHDAHGAGLATFEQTAKNLNQATWNAMLNYSPAGEIFAALSRTVVGLSNQTDLSPAVQKNLAEVINKLAEKTEVAPAELLQTMVTNTKDMAFRADDMKLQALGVMASIDQYALEGGNYQVTQQDRVEAAARRAELTNTLTAAESQAIEKINALLKGQLEESAPALVQDPEMDMAPEGASSLTEEVLSLSIREVHELMTLAARDNRLSDEMKEAVWAVALRMRNGTTSLKTANVAPAVLRALVQVYESNKAARFGGAGTAAFSSDARLVAAFEAKPEMSGVEALRLAFSVMGRDMAPNMRDFYKALITKLASSMPADLTVSYVTPQNSTLDTSLPTGFGYFNLEDNKVSIVGSGFVYSSVTGELLVHELLHGVLANEIRAASKSPGTPAHALVQELEALREKALTFVATLSKDMQKKHGYALSSVDEMISYGLSNTEFQSEVLSKVTMRSKTTGNVLISGMKAFVHALTDFFFNGTKSRQASISNGMGVLISNVSGLFTKVAQDQAAKGTGVLSMAVPDPMSTAQTLSTLDIHEALNAGTVSPAFDTHLRNLLGGIVEKLHGPYGAFKESLKANQAATPLDAWLKALNTGVAPFASKILASGFAVSQQEAHAIEQVEATVRAALNSGATKIAYKELSDLYTEVHAKLKPSDFASQADYDFVFKLEKSNGDRSDYLARFAALGLAHEGFNQMLKIATDRDTRKVAAGQTFAERLQTLFEQVLEFFHGKVTSTYAGQKADEKLTALVEQLVDIEAKKRFTIARKATETSYLAPVEEGARNLTEAIRAKVGEIAGSAFVRNSASGFVQGAGGLARTIANDRVEWFLEGLSKLRDQELKGRQGIVAGMINDVRGPLEKFQALLRESKNHERARKSTINAASSAALQAFEEGGKKLSALAKSSISAVFLRTGAHVLVDKFTMAEIEGILGDKVAMGKTITAVESDLDVFGRFKPYFIEQANALAYYKATGRVKGQQMMMNAHNIAKMYGTAMASQITEAQSTQAEATIEMLVSLYALEYVDGTARAAAKETLRYENQRADGNGVEFVLKLHKSLEAESKERLFKGNAALMMHGYTPEIYNPHTEIKTAYDDEGAELMAMGYSQGALVETDPADPDRAPKRIYVLRDGGLQPYLTGVMSYTGKEAKGSKQHNGYMNVNTADGFANASLQASISASKQAAVRSLFNAGPRKNLATEKNTFMAPVLNEQGEVVNWRYLMQESTKDSLLERDNRFEKVLGTLAGSIYDKETTREQNAKAIRALRDQYDLDVKAGNTSGYVMVGAKSTDASFRETWRMLPADSKTDAREIWGRDGMMVKSNALDIMFGYRKLSLADMFDKDPSARGHMEKLFVGMMEFNLTTYARTKGMNQADAENYAKRAGVVVARGERVWQELVRETKDIIVVKTGIVMMGNIWSNLSLLAMNGVSIKDIVSTHLVALKGATQYQQDTAELAKLNTFLDADYTQGNEAEIRRNIVRLEDSLARNPVKELIDAGLMPTIVEDVAADDDIYSYKSAFARKVDKATSNLNPMVLAGARQVYMAHDTKLYQGLSRITQLSDFVARYTLYQHLITKKNNPLSKDQAVQEASDAFVNYDIPMHRGLQFTDDMGITMFTKYFMRIQRVLLKLSRENPARVFTTLVLGNFLDLGPIVLDSTALSRIGNNPLTTGAFQLPGSLDQLATVHAAMSLVK